MQMLHQQRKKTQKDRLLLSRHVRERAVGGTHGTSGAPPAGARSQAGGGGGGKITEYYVH